MSIVHMARVEAIGESVEEEVVLRIDGIALVCFAAYCPYAIDVGRCYPVELSLFAGDDLDVIAVEPDGASIERVGGGFAHVLTGVLSGSTLAAGVTFDDPSFEADHAWLDGRTVQIRVDRIDAAFLPRETAAAVD